MSNHIIFQEVKEKIDARFVVSEFLGEAEKISGENYFWKSPFYEGDNEPSFCANPEQITDFSRSSDFGSGQDIFNFIVKYNNLTHCITQNEMSNYDALNWLNTHYNLELDISTFDSTKSEESKNQIVSKKSEKKKSKITYSLEVVENATNAISRGIIALFDDASYITKPTSDDVKGIRNRTNPNNVKLYQLQDIKELIITGHTCIPASIKSKKDWIDEKSNYQIFMIDFDNSTFVEKTDETTGKKHKEKINLTVDDDRHITVDKILKYCEEINLIPTFIYNTFSHTEKQHKFRLVFVLDTPIHNLEEIEGVYKTLKELFKDYYIDPSASDIARLFFGGQKIVFESDNFFKVVEKEIENAESEKAIIEYSEVEKECNEFLKNSSYETRNKHLGYFTKNGTFNIISNFIPFCINKINYINGNDKVTKYEMKCVLLDNPDIQLSSLIIDTNSYSKCDFVLGSNWDRHCIISAGNGNTSRLREVMQIISRQTMNEKNVYTHTGFRKIENKLCYLFHGGIIGNVENVETDLSADKLQQYCFTDKTFDLTESIKKSLSFLDIANYSITMPILATIYLAPLKSLLAQNDILADFILFIQGQSGARKSSITAVALSHFGNFNRDKFPCSFRDTLNSIEKKAFILKDTINVVDDFNPENIGTKMLDTIEKMFAMYGDKAGRTRMSQDGQTLREPYIARGLCIVTGEMLPDVAQSRIARSLIVTIKKDSIDLNKLSMLQDNTEELAYCMKNFIKWIIDNEIDVIEYAKSEFKNNQNLQKSLPEIHGRTKEIACVLPIGFTLFTLFAQQQGAISEDEKKWLDNKIMTVLNSLIQEQTQEVTELKPSEMFYSALDELLSSNVICVRNLKTNGSIGGESKEIGYYDPLKDCLYLYPNAIYNEVVRFYNNKFPIPQKTLWRYLVEEGLLYQNDKKRYSVARTVFNKKVTVIEIDANPLNVLKNPNQELQN